MIHAFCQIDQSWYRGRNVVHYRNSFPCFILIPSSSSCWTNCVQAVQVADAHWAALSSQNIALLLAQFSKLIEMYGGHWHWDTIKCSKTSIVSPMANVPSQSCIFNSSEVSWWWKHPDRIFYVFDVLSLKWWFNFKWINLQCTIHNLDSAAILYLASMFCHIIQSSETWARRRARGGQTCNVNKYLIELCVNNSKL